MSDYVDKGFKPTVSQSSFKFLHRVMTAYEKFNIPIISTTRPFEFYRKVLFGNAKENELKEQLLGKVLVDVGCGLTPYVEDSMFQWCRRNDIEFYAVDPKLEKGFQLGLFDSVKSLASGARYVPNPDIEGTEKAIGTYSNNLPFDDQSVDVIVSCWLIFSWLRSEQALTETFNEFNRVLKPGGEIRLYPTPWWPHVLESYPELGQLFASYHVEQQFMMNRKLRNPLPFYSTVLTKEIG